MAIDKTVGPTNSGKSASVAYLDHAHWQRLLDAGSGDSALSSWLALLCGRIDQATRAVLVARQDGPFRPVAFWPEQASTSRFLMETVNEALTRRLDLIREKKDDEETVGVARLIRHDTRVVAAVGLEVRERREGVRQAILRDLQWGSAWIELLERRRSGQSDEHAIRRLTLALDAIAVAGEQQGFRAAASAALTSLSVQMNAARVSFGVRKSRGCRVYGVSNTTRFDRRVTQMRALAEAMDEAVDQLAPVWVPGEPGDGDPLVTRKAVALSQSRSGGTVIVQPFVRGGRPAGTMVLERAPAEPPAPHIRDAVGDVVALLAPVLYDRIQEELWLGTRALLSIRGALEKIFGPGYFTLKSVLAALALVTAFFAWFQTDFRVTANARLRGAIERVVIAPLDGYIMEAPPRSGDSVKSNDLLVRLDDVEYRLERYAWTARKLQYEAEYNKALASFDRAGINILKARIEEAEAQIRLNDTRIDLTRITSPFEAVIVSGDLSKSLGQSVRRGEELFRIAPLSAYRVEIEVPESDILYIKEESRGILVLTSLPTSSLPVVVETVTPVTGASDGHNYFMVEARLVRPSNVPIAPGMEGIAKIEAGKARLVWIWTRRLQDWLWLHWWRWQP